MAGTKIRLPIGMDNFEKIRKNNFYYVDKTGLIVDLLHNWSEVTLITRPRRFGKSLNMSMLQQFFSPDTDKKTFEGLKIAGETQLCEKYMGQYPVIFLSLKSISAGSYGTAYRMAADLIRAAAIRVDETIGADARIHPSQRAALNTLLGGEMEESALYGSLYTLSGILGRHYNRKVIILIDEYDVPLEKAWEQGYYDQMVILIRNLFERALKTNEYLEFAVLTGCMRISRESIFTGLNNLRVLGIDDARLDEYFGFTDAEVRRMLDDCGIPERYETVQAWYDGYRFGKADVYCPWDVINYCDKLLYDPEAEPECYWMNSSGNTIVRKLLEYSGNATVRGEIERLVNGEAVEKEVRQQLTYPEMYSSIDNVWSVLYTTGYLTREGRRSGSRQRLVIPNQEVCSIYEEQILEMSRENIKRDGASLGRLCDALQEGDAAAAQACLNAYMVRTISVRDTAVRRSWKESFYHGMLLGMLNVRDSWEVTSNRESGSGYSDLMVRDEAQKLGMVIEIKYAESGDLEAACREALRQIEAKRYAQELYRERFTIVRRYGIAFHLKECRVLLDETDRPQGG